MEKNYFKPKTKKSIAMNLNIKTRRTLSCVRYPEGLADPCQRVVEFTADGLET